MRKLAYAFDTLIYRANSRRPTEQSVQDVGIVVRE